MSKNQVRKTVTDDRQTTANDDGFTDVSRPELAGWARPDAGTVIHGRIVGAFSFMQRERGRGMKKRDVLAVELLAPANIVRSGDKTPFPVEAGTVVGLGLNPAINELRSYVDGRAEFKVRWLDKSDIGGGHTAWRAEVKVKGRKQTRPWMGSAPQADPSTADDWDGEGAPF